MKRVNELLVSFDLFQAINKYEESSDYINRKADFADAFGFITRQMQNDSDNVENWLLIMNMLTEFQDTVDLFFKEAKVE